jgi:hypothetical protein
MAPYDEEYENLKKFRENGFSFNFNLDGKNLFKMNLQYGIKAAC